MLDYLVGELRLVPYGEAPPGWHLCDGSTLSQAAYPQLYKLLGGVWGPETGGMFTLPDLRGRTLLGTGQVVPLLEPYVVGQLGGQEQVTLTVDELPQHAHQVQATSNKGSSVQLKGKVFAAQPTNTQSGLCPYTQDLASNVALMSEPMSPLGGGQPHDNMQPFLTLQCAICLDGLWPQDGITLDIFVGEVRAFAFRLNNVLPAMGLMPCDGRSLAVSDYQSLFSVIGYTYGGSASTFHVPDPSGRIITHAQLVGSDTGCLGATGGDRLVKLDLASMPTHHHPLHGGEESDSDTPINHYWGDSPLQSYGDAASPAVLMSSLAVAPTGGSQAHDNMQPYAAVDFAIAFSGIYPSRP